MRSCQRSLPAANSLQANALCEFAGTVKHSQPFDASKKMEEKIIQILSTGEHQDLGTGGWLNNVSGIRSPSRKSRSLNSQKESYG